MHEKLTKIFANLGVQIHDSAEKDCGNEIDKFVAMAFYGEPDWNRTAHYDHIVDKIYIPDGRQHYDQVAAHELIHWTGHKSRSGRYGLYNKELCCPHHAANLEELVAELGGLLLLNKLGIQPTDNRRRAIARFRMSFRGPNSNLSEKEAYARAQADAEVAVNFILEEV